MSFGVSYAVTPWLRRLALCLEITDRPDARKVHTHPVPYLGGLAFHAALVVVFLTGILGFPYLFDDSTLIFRFLVLLVIAAGFQILGILDDALHLRPSHKLIVEAGLSWILVQCGFSISQLTSPFGGTIPVGWIGDVLSVFWILTIVNAINFIDGLDGLAAGVVFFAALANWLIALHPWQHFICLISLAVMGATLGFLPHNLSRKKIFMGDAGSLYLGVLLAGSSLASNVKGATVMSLSLPLVILGIPLLDTVLTVIRRGRAGTHLFQADREHIHHRLLRLGFTDRQAVWFIYGLCFLLAMAAVLASHLPNQYALLFLFLFLAALVWGGIVFRAFERRLVPGLGKKNGDELSPSVLSKP
jgi:UDP-GlcNAc:undecaprenyl-phosphate GlcNAc-1-phosphate transferase